MGIQVWLSDGSDGPPPRLRSCASTRMAQQVDAGIGRDAQHHVTHCTSKVRLQRVVDERAGESQRTVQRLIVEGPHHQPVAHSADPMADRIGS